MRKFTSVLLVLVLCAALDVVAAAADTSDAGKACTQTQFVGLSEPENLGDGSAALQVTLENGKEYVIGFTLGEGETPIRHKIIVIFLNIIFS